TPLHLAVLSGQVRLVEALLRAGADPGQGDLEGRSPLHLAALAADEALLRPLLAHLGESHAHLVNMADYHGLHPLHLSVRRGGERCLRLLVGGGAKINAGEQKSGSSALHLAVRDNLFKVACYLITELKADVNAATFGGNTALHLAASQGSPTLCSMLIAAGADKNLENDEPLSFSSSSSSDEDEDQEEDHSQSQHSTEAQSHLTGRSPLRKRPSPATPPCSWPPVRSRIKKSLLLPPPPSVVTPNPLASIRLHSLLALFASESRHSLLLSVRSRVANLSPVLGHWCAAVGALSERLCMMRPSPHLVPLQPGRHFQHLLQGSYQCVGTHACLV
ncbi:unnamed protein product, partial [Arctogadus glacialis]